MLTSLNEDFFSLGLLLNRLLNENYTGKKIKFINVDFSTQVTYDLHSVLPKNTAYYFGGHLRYYGILDIAEFTALNKHHQTQFIWETACEYLQASGKAIKNSDLIEAAKYAYNRGIEIGLNPDYKVVKAAVVLFGQSMQACIWINFRPDGMYSKLVLEKDGQATFEKDIDKAKNGVEFFLVMYKSIEARDNEIIIKGAKDVDYLPMRIKIDRNDLAVNRL